MFLGGKRCELKSCFRHEGGWGRNGNAWWKKYTMCFLIGVINQERHVLNENINFFNGTVIEDTFAKLKASDLVYV